ncbi:hypothetical protein QNH39_04915 [Neobacillus novalis]|uniref:Uncharacterized protein n=1 Tax=Neobacillus novalis TaxID=220687 RepID=A0AA95MSX1_9BACI|nr:hypothetical protein [Neobacillus novalis]WHY87203.1 hypothetical protein QNH39_04915 [Neobacillus novalis]
MSNIPVGVWISLETLIVCLGVWRVIQFIKAYKNTEQSLPTVEKIEAMVNSQIKNKVLAAFLTRDFLTIYYLFSPSNKREPEQGTAFTLHKKIGYGGIMFGFLFVLVLEAGGVSYFLHSWSTVIAWIHLALSLYLIIFLISDYKAIKRNPVLLSPEKLHIRLGLRLKAQIYLHNIDSIKAGKINFEKDKKKKDVWNLTLFGFEDPDFEITLKEPLLLRDGVGRDCLIIKIYLTLDEKEEFLAQVKLLKEKVEVVGI